MAPRCLGCRGRWRGVVGRSSAFARDARQGNGVRHFGNHLVRQGSRLELRRTVRHPAWLFGRLVLGHRSLILLLWPQSLAPLHRVATVGHRIGWPRDFDGPRVCVSWRSPSLLPRLRDHTRSVRLEFSGGRLERVEVTLTNRGATCAKRAKRSLNLCFRYIEQ